MEAASLAYGRASDDAQGTRTPNLIPENALMHHVPRHNPKCKGGREEKNNNNHHHMKVMCNMLRGSADDKRKLEPSKLACASDQHQAHAFCDYEQASLYVHHKMT